ncbi:MAG TPA: acetamidase/formamidase family protein [Kofleriaceae bacterium]|nr:acetamidase/formamidase family protein [Kofleriaceae bacterium]
MRTSILAFLLAGLWFTTARADPPALTGRWSVSADFFGVPRYFTMQLVQQWAALSGDFDGDKLTGTAQGDAVDIAGKDERGGYENLKATVRDGVLTGSVEIAFSGDPTHPSTHAFTATRVPPRPARPTRHVFTPTAFHRQFSATIKPVLTVTAGDTIATWTVDAGGSDAKGTARVLGGNPETGPFYVEGALPGDTLVVHIVKLRLNRDWAISDDAIVPRGLDSGLSVQMKDTGKDTRWRLDRTRGVATSEATNPHLAGYSVPLRPMLGCVGVAPGPAQAPPGTGDSGNWGGNMDFNEVVEGATVYLPVNNPGALLYVGDAHAAQGDGELTGNALETSADVEVTVDVISGKRVPAPRIEGASHVFAMGLAGSLDEAFRLATSNMAAWLTDQYQLTPSEVAQVLGTSAEYRVTEVADRNAGMVLGIRKDRLRALAVRAH